MSERRLLRTQGIIHFDRQVNSDTVGWSVAVLISSRVQVLFSPLRRFTTVVSLTEILKMISCQPKDPTIFPLALSSRHWMNVPCLPAELLPVCARVRTGIDACKHVYYLSFQL